MTPIEKNIIVVDEVGNSYEATYQKRAMGLVKNGRARFVSENKICLACPPNIFLEDTTMNDNIQANNESVATETQVDSSTTLSMDFVLSRIDQILSDTTHIHEAIKAVLDIPVMVPNEEMISYQGDFAGQAKAEAITKAVLSRETTNQQLIRLLEKMYDDLKPKAPSEEILKLRQLSDILGNYPPSTARDILKKAAQQMFVGSIAPTVMPD